MRRTYEFDYDVLLEQAEDVKGLRGLTRTQSRPTRAARWISLWRITGIITEVNTFIMSSISAGQGFWSEVSP